MPHTKKPQSPVSARRKKLLARSGAKPRITCKTNPRKKACPPKVGPRGGTTKVQAFGFPRAEWNRTEARAWLKKHGHKAPKAEQSKTFWWYRQQDKRCFTSFATEYLSAGDGRPVLLRYGITEKKRSR